jgi:hypothetical protein
MPVVGPDLAGFPCRSETDLRRGLASLPRLAQASRPHQARPPSGKAPSGRPHVPIGDRPPSRASLPAPTSAGLPPPSGKAPSGWPHVPIGGGPPSRAGLPSPQGQASRPIAWGLPSRSAEGCVGELHGSRVDCRATSASLPCNTPLPCNNCAASRGIVWACFVVAGHCLIGSNEETRVIGSSRSGDHWARFSAGLPIGDGWRRNAMGTGLLGRRRG